MVHWPVHGSKSIVHLVLTDGSVLLQPLGHLSAGCDRRARPGPAARLGAPACSWTYQVRMEASGIEGPFAGGDPYSQHAVNRKVENSKFTDLD